MLLSCGINAGRGVERAMDAIDTESLLARPATEQMIALDPSAGRYFMLFIDTEEEFDWSAPFSRSSTRVTATGGMARCQDYLSAAGVRPVYLTDYPVLDSDRVVDMIGQWLADETADVGAHLHPWVNPPLVESLSPFNSFVGNLPEMVEGAKLAALCDHMERRVGLRPIVYRAGRYGVGPNTARLLVRHGFELDVSVRSGFDYSDEGGPDFRGMPVRPYRTGPDGRLLELPLSTAYTGHLRPFGSTLDRLAQPHPHAAAMLSRLGLFSRVPLTPEGVTPAQCRAAIDALIDNGLAVMSFSFHSPTVEPGNTPYVRNGHDLDSFYRWWDVVLDHLAARGVEPLSLGRFLKLARGVGG